MAPSYQLVSPTKSRLDTDGTKSKLYPFSLILIGLWTVFIVTLVWWMERVVRDGPHIAHLVTNNYTPPWTMTTLPSLLMTVFAQAHVPITGIHLARIAVSALQHSSSSPNSWLELFWLADQEWLGPVGIARTTWKSIRSRMRTSLTFILFATTSAVALITPVLMTQAYTTDGVEFMHIQRPIQVLDAISFEKMQQLEASTQLSVGLQSWGVDKYLASNLDHEILYYPRELPHDELSIFNEPFVAGNVANATVYDLPGLRLNVTCSLVSSSDLDTGNLNASWPFFCQSRIPQFNGLTPVRRTGGAKDLSEFSLYLCNNQTTAFPFTDTFQSPNAFRFTDADQTQSRNMGYLYYNYTSFRDNKTQNTSGLIQCNSTLTTGTVVADGLPHSYRLFAPRRFLNASSAKEPLLDPLFAIFTSLGRSEVDPNMVDDLFQTPLGLSKGFAEDVSRSVVDNLRSAVTIFTTALARLSRDMVSYPAQVPIPVAVFSRNDAYATCTYLLLGLWGILIGTITVRSYRRTFSPSLSSYVAAEMIFRERALLEGVPIGEVDDNGRLKTPFRLGALYEDSTIKMHHRVVT
ncbi:hypothetical protein V5O48_011703 [Marasmius crinis-equi]|uniref:Transmembrane protein n=1 Tax=Marasmius crinis-equi TaxID=585013 RepID=A0ABR3F515_9AGAR